MNAIFVNNILMPVEIASTARQPVYVSNTPNSVESTYAAAKVLLWALNKSPFEGRACMDAADVASWVADGLVIPCAVATPVTAGYLL